MMFTCRNCGRDGYKPLFTVKENAIVKCRRCNLVQLGEYPGPDTLKPIYTGAYFSKGKYLMDKAGRLEQERRMTALEVEGIRSGATILDVGMATGEFISAARRRYELYGLEVSSQAIEIASKHMPELAHRFYCGDHSDLPFGDTKFDAITMWDVIEHLPQPIEVLWALRRILRPDGMIFLSTPDIGALIPRLLGKYWAFMTPPEHICFFSRFTLKDCLERSGYKMVHWFRKGKWVNLGFFAYKVRRSLPMLMPETLLRTIRHSGLLASRCFYVPSGDIQYVSARLE